MQKILKQKEITISHKINISILENYIWIAPNSTEVMDKKFKDLCRIKNIPKNKIIMMYDFFIYCSKTYQS